MGNLTCKGKVEEYLNRSALVHAPRDAQAARRGPSRTTTDTGKGGKDRPSWIKNGGHRHCAQLALVVTQQQWTLKTDEVFDKIQGGADEYGVFNEYYQFQLKMLSGMIEMVQGDLEKLHAAARR